MVSMRPQASATTLKLLAMTAMTIDHVGAYLMPKCLALRAIGRIAMPMFAFFVAEGFRKTHDVTAYVWRMLVWAIVSQVPFYLLGGARHGLNVMFTFLVAIVALSAIRTSGKWFEGHGRDAFLEMLSCAAITYVAILVTSTLNTDYEHTGVPIVLIAWASLEHAEPMLYPMATLVYAVNDEFLWPYAAIGAFACMAYDGRRGKGLKWLFYVFYPAHLTIIYIIKCVI